MWAGPTRNWLSALDRILAMDVETIVPGHGPITDKHGVAQLKSYFEYVYDETRTRFEAGMPATEAAQDIPLAATRRGRMASVSRSMSQPSTGN